MNHPVFCVTPSARIISQELMPLLALAIIQVAINHLFNGNALSSKIVPTFTEQCFRSSHFRHSQRSRVEMNRGVFSPRRGQQTLFGQRSLAIKLNVVSTFANSSIASCRIS